MSEASHEPGPPQALLGPDGRPLHPPAPTEPDQPAAPWGSPVGLEELLGALGTAVPPERPMATVDQLTLHEIGESLDSYGKPTEEIKPPKKTTEERLVVAGLRNLLTRRRLEKVTARHKAELSTLQALETPTDHGHKTSRDVWTPNNPGDPDPKRQRGRWADTAYTLTSQQEQLLEKLRETTEKKHGKMHRLGQRIADRNQRIYDKIDVRTEQKGNKLVDKIFDLKDFDHDREEYLKNTARNKHFGKFIVAAVRVGRHDLSGDSGKTHAHNRRQRRVRKLEDHHRNLTYHNAVDGVSQKPRTPAS